MFLKNVTFQKFPQTVSDKNNNNKEISDHNYTMAADKIPIVETVIHLDVTIKFYNIISNYRYG